MIWFHATDVQSSIWIIYTWKRSFDRYYRKISIKEAECSGNWKTEQRKNPKNKRKEGTSKTSPKNSVLWIKQPEQVEQKVTPPIQILMLTYHNGVKQKSAKINILECISLGENVTLRLKMRKWKKEVVKRKRLKYVSVAEKVTLIL